MKVAAAAPVMPQPKTKMKSGSSTKFRLFATRKKRSGVIVSPWQRKMEFTM